MANEYIPLELIQNQIIGALSVAIGFFVALILNSSVQLWRDKQTFLSMLEVIKNEAKSNKKILNESFCRYYDIGIVLRGFTLKAVADYLVTPLFVSHTTKEQLSILQTYQRDLTLANLYREKSEKCLESESIELWINIIKVWKQNLKLCKKDIENVININ